jgi:hypothetical protein
MIRVHLLSIRRQATFGLSNFAAGCWTLIAHRKVLLEELFKTENDAPA